MADTIITNSPEKSDGDGGAGWFLALVVIIALVIGGVVLYRRGAFRAAPPANNVINVTLPNPTTSPSSNGY